MNRIAPFSAEFSALWVSAAAAVLFYLCCRPRVPHPPAYARAVFFWVLAAGLLVRWVLAWLTPGNYDRESWQIAADVFARGGNIYAESARYNYSPLWFWLIGLLDRVREAAPLISLHVAARLFLTLVDTATACLLWTWPRLSAWDRARQSALFFVNPVSFLLTGAHGQFDNLSVFFLVLALWTVSRPVPSGGRRLAGWFWATVGTVVKHLLFYELLIFTLHFYRKRKAALLCGVSALLFALTFWPYWSGGRDGILNNVLNYRSHPMPYGLASFGELEWLRVLFAASLFAYPFLVMKERRLSTKLLLGALFFLTFTTGLGVQYFILPVALGALRPARGFFLYTFVTAAYLLGSYFNMGIAAFSWVPLWAVWAAAAYWWGSLHFSVRR